MDPRHDPYATGARLPWLPQSGAYGAAPPGADDVLVRLGGWVLAALATTVLAAVTLLAAGALYGLATWRRWRWWPLVVAGVAGLLVVLGLGAEHALQRHLGALRDLTAPHPGVSVGDLAAQRWRSWALVQFPLGLPLGAVLAGLARHQVQCVAAHDLSPRARRRREAEALAISRQARRRAAQAPVKVGERGVLGAWAGGDLTGWRTGRWCALPDAQLGLGWVVLGLPGSGKTETLLRLAQLGISQGCDVHVLDAKGERSTQERFAALCEGAGVTARLFPEEPYDGFRGEPDALRNRLGRVVDYTEPYYQDGARDLLAALVSDGPPRSLAALLAALPTLTLEGLDPAVRRGTLARYRAFAAAAAGGLDGDWAFEDVRASYVLLDGVALGDDAPRLARFFVEDFSHYAAARKPPGRRALLLIDEFSALRLDNAAAILERLRSFGAGVVVASQSVEGLHDDPREADRLLNAASCLITHRLADPEQLVLRAGTVRRAERSHQLEVGGPTGAGSLRLQESFRLDPNELRCLAPGQAAVVSAGRVAHVAVAQARGGQAPLARFPRPGPGPGVEGREPHRNVEPSDGDEESWVA
jgi:hypothetical protein